MIRAVCLWASLASAAIAETPMTGEEFEAYVTGRTLTYATQNAFHGVERYLPRRRVYWQNRHGECIKGRWYEEGTNICFVYENDPEPKCWEVFRTQNGLRADFTSYAGPPAIVEVTDSPEPLICPGPELLG